MRYCKCGAVLSRSNGSRQCGPCFTAERDGQIFQLRGWAAQAVVDAFSHPERYDSPTEYLSELTRYLDQLCRAYGAEPPKDIYAAFGVSGRAGVARVGGEVGKASSALSEPSETEEEAMRFGASVI